MPILRAQNAKMVKIYTLERSHESEAILLFEPPAQKTKNQN